MYHLSCFVPYLNQNNKTQIKNRIIGKINKIKNFLFFFSTLVNDQVGWPVQDHNYLLVLTSKFIK